MNEKSIFIVLTVHIWGELATNKTTERNWKQQKKNNLFLIFHCTHMQYAISLSFFLLAFSVEKKPNISEPNERMCMLHRCAPLYARSFVYYTNFSFVIRCHCGLGQRYGVANKNDGWRFSISKSFFSFGFWMQGNFVYICSLKNVSHINGKITSETKSKEEIVINKDNELK